MDFQLVSIAQSLGLRALYASLTMERVDNTFPSAMTAADGLFGSAAQLGIADLTCVQYARNRRGD